MLVAAEPRNGVETMMWVVQEFCICACNAQTGFWREKQMSAQADTKVADIIKYVSARHAHLAKIGVSCRVVPTCRQHVGDICS